MFSELLVHTVEVYARSGRLDRFGQPVDVNPGQTTGSPVASFPCRAEIDMRGFGGGRVMEERSLDTFERTWTMFTEHDVTISEDDALRILNQDGTVRVEKAQVKLHQVVYDGLGPHHAEWTLQEQSGPNPERV